MDRIRMKKSVQKYLRNIQKALPLTYGKRKEIMRRFSQGVYEYCSETENITMDMVYHEFGTVEEVVDSLMSEIVSEYVVKHFRLRRFVIYFLICVMILNTGYCVTLKYFIHYMPVEIQAELEDISKNK